MDLSVSVASCSVPHMANGANHRNNIALNAVTGIQTGLGLNPWPTFDWNLFGGAGLYLPTFAIVNQCVGIVIAALMILGIWYSNAWETGYLPINTQGTFDNTGSRYKVTKVLDGMGRLDEGLFQKYSQPWFSAGFIVYNIWCFASYSASFSFVYLFHRQTIVRGFKGIYREVFRKGKDDGHAEVGEDIHTRLMRAYKDAPDWWYLILLILPIFFGVAAIEGWPTGAPVSALFYGLIMPAILIIPIGIIQAVTGNALAINVLAALVGGYINAGNVNGLMYFKCWAYLSSYQALYFCLDLKTAHYMKMSQRVVFWAQIVATFIFAMVSALEYNLIMGIRDVCTDDAPFRMTCPSQKSFFTVTIFWGVLSPKKLFGPGQRYNMMLLGFPLGFLLVFGYWVLKKMYPRSNLVRQMHPVMLCMGPVSYGAPYNLAFNIGNLYVNLISFQYIRKRYLAFWSKVSSLCICVCEGERENTFLTFLTVELCAQRRPFVRHCHFGSADILCVELTQGRHACSRLVGK